MTMSSHLTEADRQSLADGSLDIQRRRAAEEHLAQCGECSADVRRLEALVKNVRAAALPNADVGELWPDIQSRIERAKVVALHGARPVAAPRRLLRWAILSSAAVAAVVLFAFPILTRNRGDVSPAEKAPAGLIPVSDSLQSYEAEARVLLNHLEVQRAVMRPEAAAVIDRDLKTIDGAIDELKLAIANDPRNLALRQLLASSYRQKVDLLKRAGNAG
jgi:anti-sigma-K factor RskA